MATCITVEGKDARVLLEALRVRIFTFIIGHKEDRAKLREWKRVEKRLAKSVREYERDERANAAHAKLVKAGKVVLPY